MSSANFGVLLRCKVIVVGDAGVGKSAIVQMFHSKGSHYPRQYNMTTGCDFVMKEIKVPESDYTVELHIYDCAGQSVFKDLTSQYWKNSNIVIFVYDVTKPESFQNLGEWLDLVRKKCPEKVLPGVVVANKVDLEDRVKVHTTEGAEFARNNSLEFCQISAFRDINVESPFSAAAKLYSQAYQNKLETLNGI
ncbi:hypothetical protein GUITHDRAFT_175448 [Guillardia theta CCMP2712]|uniref:Uncharacterized protein n=2 Tax=Guillardia theta TaxID=55529 RepID=L1JA00_GUITC|nr:hypothetical protein GUITHDRAFT_175448 [Guillardia theta CCMP2712]EKX44929.1 hypothetical protein GUITHDRAFT_175448 [Guillardia theta CCMP2712]|mmetsp:Transcript_12312/g.42897  ORF Transcript_12312/g.42897 Transcript_12312/m.42897 type:complete len:192 (+) Transcript_12312:86-661(+)|eukprot:XP_005831909.1 hypothetical protein GUITHDRAFT_175448 [Guillardia theta CCMP2712]